jgi:acyl-coenzyme A synthetase/AMP-(fatty) acid ligase
MRTVAAPLVFLDVDGVLNSSRWCHAVGGWGAPPKAPESLTREVLRWDPDCVGRVRALVEAVHAEIVITSSWRTEMTVEAFREAFAVYGWTRAPVTGSTSVFDEDGEWPVRGREVEAWMRAAGAGDRAHVCLDDTDEFLEHHVLVRTDWRVGVQDADIDAALCHFVGAGQAP